uniref:Uncharacterized protein n=1 Tax=Plectus sambesii TaxID=2011161 RepID=A0A914WGK1_9BILA
MWLLKMLLRVFMLIFLLTSTSRHLLNAPHAARFLLPSSWERSLFMDVDCP